MKICKYKGIPIRLHISFIVLAVALIIMQVLSNGPASAISPIILGAILFGSVALHEIGHAMMAKKYGIKTKSITLYPFGGIALIEGLGSDPREERNIALAGPAVNLALAVVSAPLVFVGIPFSLEFCFLNLIMGVFNLFPAYPMDGGRVLKTSLEARLGRIKATKIAVKISLIFSIVFCIISYILWSPSLLFIGMFLFYVNYPHNKR